MALRTRPRELKWRRQHPVPPYVVDFFCAERRTAVEIDGDSHGPEQVVSDQRRDEALRRAGVKVLRVPAWAVKDRLEAVVAWVTAQALEQPGRAERAADEQAGR